jgi:small subunit ribosomal protein S8
MYSDPIADLLTRVRNAHMAGHATVSLPSSKLKLAIAQILKQEGFIEDFAVQTEGADGQAAHPTLRLALKYAGTRRERRPVISGIERVSTPGRRVYARNKDIPWVLSGMGIAILSTPKGVMTGARARQLGVGGEVICKVW